MLLTIVNVYDIINKNKDKEIHCMIISTYSKRIYKNKIDTKQLDQLLIDCNDAKIYCYSQLANQKITEKKLKYNLCN